MSAVEILTCRREMSSIGSTSVGFVQNVLGSKKKKKKCALFNVEYFEISRRFFCRFGMVSPKYKIHRANIKPIPCWAEIFTLYGNT